MHCYTANWTINKTGAYFKKKGLIEPVPLFPGVKIFKFLIRWQVMEGNLAFRGTVVSLPSAEWIAGLIRLLILSIALL